MPIPSWALSVTASPGLRTPGHVDGDELAFRAVLGQQVSVAGARSVAARLVAAHGRKLCAPSGTITSLFPGPAAIAQLSPGELPMPAGTGQGRDRASPTCSPRARSSSTAAPTGSSVAQRLSAIAGIGPWTVAYVRMRALGDPDAFLASDLGVRRALEARGMPGDPRSAAKLAESWRPWRSYALQYLWSAPPSSAHDGKGLKATRKEQAA